MDGAGGDGSHHETEDCDDNNVASGDGCSGSCVIEEGWACGNGTLLSPDVCITLCGNGIPTSGEDCDDGNLLNGDGCDASCAVEKGWLCTVVQSVVQDNGYDSSPGDLLLGPINLGPSECRKQVDRPAMSPRAGPVFTKGLEYVQGKELSEEEKFGIQQLYVNITMSVEQASAVIRYTLNGSDPMLVGETYVGTPLQLKGGTTRIRAVASRTVDWPFWSNAPVDTFTVGPETDGDFVISICQDGIRTNVEECDDGLGGSGGCSMECTVENGWICPDSLAEAADISPSHVLPEIKDRCYDCTAAAKAAELEAAAAGLPPPPSIELNCPSGLYMGVECGTCQSCPKGFFCQGGPDNQRFPCAAGTWVDYINAFECESCPPHSTSERRAVSKQDCQCMPGFTGEAASEVGCQRCINAYKSVVGPQPCVACPENAATEGDEPAVRKTSCKCLAGYHNQVITDWYASLPVLEDDQEVIITPQMPEPQDVVCVKCQGGHYCAGGMEPQVQCPQNMWSAPGSVQCEWCPANAQQPIGTLITSPDECACSEGFYSREENMSPPCAACAPGLFKGVAGSLPRTSCRTCPPGSYSSVENATSESTCVACSIPGSVRKLTSPRGSIEAQDCLSGVWLAVANMQASQGRPTRVHRYSFQGRGGVVTTLRAPPHLPAEYDSDELGRKVGVIRVAWLQSLDWLLFMPLGGLIDPEALLIASSLDELHLLQMDFSTESLVKMQTIAAPSIGRAQELVVFHNNNPTFLMTVNSDLLSGKIYELKPPDAQSGTPPAFRPLCSTGGVSKCGIYFPGPTRHTSDLHAFLPYAEPGASSTWYLLVANQRHQIGPNLNFEATSYLLRWQPAQTVAAGGEGCVSPTWDCGE